MMMTDYHLEQCLGGGPMTVVFAATETTTSRSVAIKFVRPEWEDQAIAVRLLQREAHVGLSVRHPHLVEVISVHLDSPAPYLVMERLMGESVRERLRRGYRLDIADALWIARQTAEAMAALHRAGYLHGDIKPENLCLTGDGTVVLLDLGFAHEPGDNASLFEEGYLLGTANYLAPELCIDNPTDTLAVDVYALGVLLFELLTGDLPFPTGTLRQVLTRHASDPPADIRKYRSVPARLARLVERLLARDPGARPSARGIVSTLVSLEIEGLGKRRVA